MIGLLLSLGGCQQDAGKTPANALNLSQSEQPPSLKPPKAGPALEAFAKISDVNAKKTAFFDYLQPQIEQENNHSSTLKEHFSILQALHKKQGQLHPVDADWLNRVAELYSVDAEEPARQLELLNAKVDTIPSALVKAQAANESAWGTSRFALEANNLFGQWCFTPGCGITPLQRNPDDTHEVQAFTSVAAGLRSYFVNLNGNQSYARLRQIRRCLQTNKQPYTGRALAAGLVNYSARGGHYVEELQAMIRINQLEEWNSNWWGDTDPDHPCYSLVQVQTDLPDPVKTNDEAETESEQPQNDPQAINASSAVVSVTPASDEADAATVADAEQLTTE